MIRYNHRERSDFVLYGYKLPLYHFVLYGYNSKIKYILSLYYTLYYTKIFLTKLINIS